MTLTPKGQIYREGCVSFGDASLSIEHGDTFLRLGEKQAKALQAFMRKAWSRG